MIGTSASLSSSASTASKEAVSKFFERLTIYNKAFADVDSTALEEAQFKSECDRLLSTCAASSSSSSAIPTFFLKSANPDGQRVVEKLNAAAVTLELDVRASQIEEFDNVSHKKVFDLLSCDGARQGISLDEYIKVIDEFQGWRRDRLAAGLPSHSEAPAGIPMATALPGEIPVADMLVMPYASPALTVEMYITCPRNPSGRVDVKTLFQKFSKQVALLKCEAELIMWDSDNDGRLTEDDLESYVKFLIPSLPCLSNLGEDALPFYCCSVIRRIFWTLDRSCRGYVKIASLIRSPVMDEWLDLQLAREDPPRNWFSKVITSQLYEKFLALDTNETGMLTAANMKLYKKGIPMVFDDGLPQTVSPIASLFIDRVFEISALYKSEMDYKSFVDFVIAVEFLPQCHRPQFFWNVFDLEGTGVVTPVVALHFFRDTYQKLVTAGCEPPPLELVVQELFDIIPTKVPLHITRDEFMHSTQAGLFSALLIDCLAFWTYENREQK